MKTYADEIFITRRDIRNYQWKLKRRRDIRKKLFLTVFTLCLVLLLVVFCYAFETSAETELNNRMISFKYYTSIQIERGESLWSIAETYMDSHYEDEQEYIEEVMKINHMKDDLLISGQHLIIPYYSAEFIQ